jgi:hypothetical protein
VYLLQGLRSHDEPSTVKEFRARGGH